MTDILSAKTPLRFFLATLRAMPRGARVSLLVMFSITALVTAGHIAMMYGFKLMVDGMMGLKPGDDAWTALRLPFFLIAGICTLHTVAFRLRSWLDIRAMTAAQDVLRETLARRLFAHSHDYFHNRFSGELAAKVANVARVWHGIVWERMTFGFIPATISVVVGGFLLWGIDRGLAAILIGMVALICAAAVLCGRSVGVVSARVADKDSEITGQLVDTFSNISSVKNFVRQEAEFSMLRRTQGAYAREYRSLTLAQMLFWGLFDVLITGLMLGFLWRLISGWSEGGMTPGDAALCMTLAWDLWWRLSHVAWNLLELSGDFGRIREAVSEAALPLDIEDPPGAPALKASRGEIRFEGVRFSHKSGRVVFDGLDLVIRPAEKIGLVGLSGAGKTTLCQLLLRNYEIDGGRIAIDGQDISWVTQNSLRDAVAVIPQDPSLFHRPLRDNILYGHPGASPARIEDAAKAAQAHDFIAALPEGYDTVVGERGVKLSGGQRQRISIARAILKGAPVLVLDEATSALDSQTERLIQSALTRAMEGRTTLVIAHRLSTLAHLDRLVVLKDGKVEEEGTLSELLAKGGHFADLWRCQADGFLPETI